MAATKAKSDQFITLQVVSDWKGDVAGAVDDIAAWREAARERHQYAGDPSREWPTYPKLYSETTFIVCEITASYPKLDPTPIQDLYDAIAAWLSDHSTRRVPPDNALALTLDRAMTVAQAIEHCILAQLKTPNDNKADAHDADDSSNWITGKQAAEIIGVTPGNVGRLAGPKGSGKPIMDNGQTGRERRYDRPSVDAYAASRNRKAKSSKEQESDAEVKRQCRKAGA